MWFEQDYRDKARSLIGTGHQLFLTFRVGYHIAFASGFFLDPSVAVTHWPVNTGMPESFREKEERWPSYQVEPGFHVGYVFW